MLFVICDGTELFLLNKKLHMSTEILDMNVMHIPTVFYLSNN